MRDHIRYILNGADAEFRGGCSRTLLDELRVQRRMTGTKEGCAEGDCGACTVLVGRLTSSSSHGDGLRYETVNSCIRLMGSLDGCHVVTIEHLNRDGVMHPVQQAMIEHHGSQCGFCTPGIVMSLYALWMADADPSEATIEKALQGNLCRCTGYAPIVRAAKAAAQVPAANDALVMERASIARRLTAWRDEEMVTIVSDNEKIIVPKMLDQFAQAMDENNDATVVAGSTDVGLWVAKHMTAISPAIFINGLDALQTIEKGEDGVTIGAGITYSDFTGIAETHYPAMNTLWHRIGGEQVRNMGTIGGNIANGSPIGDTPPALIALGARLTLQSVKGTREIALEDFFLEYGKQDRRPDEFVRSVFIPYPGKALFAVHKISKRREEDISALCGAFRFEFDGDVVSDARICFGGMAGTPKRAKTAEAALVSKPFNEANVRAAMMAMGEDYDPMSDQRASANYRMAIAKNLLLRVYLDHAGEAETLERKVA